MSTTAWLWIGFNVFVLLMLALDLGVFHRHAHEVRLKEALTWSAIWFALALVFNAGVYFWGGAKPATEFLTGYLIEKSLSIDNIFVFITIFTAMKVPSKDQHRVLFWGVLGALVMRAIFIFAGVALIQRFHWIIYLFGALLVFTGIKMALPKKEDVNVEKSSTLRLFSRFVPMSPTFEGSRFFTWHNGRRVATPLFAALVLVEVSDLIFAVDSIPAILAITNDPFIVYTSNVFAILGLRSLYFAVAHIAALFRYISYGLAAVLVFVGVKMMLVDFYKVPPLISLAVIVAFIGTSIAASVWRAKVENKSLDSV